MRVIAGTHRGRRLHGPLGTELRPTSDRVREALFSILGARLRQSRFLDLYAGTGAVGIEACSRGAQQVTCVESNKTALTLLHKNVLHCGMKDQVIMRAQTVQQFLSRPDQMQGPYDVVFADPPYADIEEFAALMKEVAEGALLAPDAWLVVEHATKIAPPMQLGPCLLRRRYGYGDTAISTFSCLGMSPA